MPALRRRLLPFTLLAIALACTPEEEEGTDTEGQEPEEMRCAELPAGMTHLAASISADEPPIAIDLVEQQELPCGSDVVWGGKLQLPADIKPGNYDLSAEAPSLYIESYNFPNCMGSQSLGVNQFVAGKLVISSVAADCVAGEIDGVTVDEDDFETRYKGAFAAASGE